MQIEHQNIFLLGFYHYLTLFYVCRFDDVFLLHWL